MSDDVPDRPPMVQFMLALNVPRNAKISAVAGVAFAAVLYGFFVVAPAVLSGVPARGRSPVLFLALAFVAAVAATMLLVTVLTVVSAVRLVREDGE